MTGFEHYLTDGRGPGYGAPLPRPARSLAWRLALALRWQRHRNRVRQNLLGFDTPVCPSEASALVARLAAHMAEVLAHAARPERAMDAVRAAPGALRLQEAVREARSRGQGLIVVSAHLGFWQLPLYLLSESTPVAALDCRAHALMRWGRVCGARAERQRPAVCRADGWTSAMEAIAEGGVVAVLPDLPLRRGHTAGSTSALLLGRRVLLPDTVATLSRATGAPVLPLFCPLGESGPDLSCGDLIAAPVRPVAGATCLSTQTLLDQFSDAIRAAPCQWLGWLHRWPHAAQLRLTHRRERVRPVFAHA